MYTVTDQLCSSLSTACLNVIEVVVSSIITCAVLGRDSSIFLTEAIMTWWGSPFEGLNVRLGYRRSNFDVFYIALPPDYSYCIWLKWSFICLFATGARKRYHSHFSGPLEQRGEDTCRKWTACVQPYLGLIVVCICSAIIRSWGVPRKKAGG